MNKLLVLITVGITARASLAAPPQPQPMTREELAQDIVTLRSQSAARDRAATTVTTGFNTSITWAKWGIGTFQSAQAMMSAFHALTSDDATCIDVSAAGAPPVPSGCAESGAMCGQCYRDAYRELGEARLKLERLRCVYQSTKRFADKAIAFGDTSSGIHALVGLEWQKQKQNILASVDQLNRSYDGKLGEFLPKLKASLEHVGQCEQQFMSEPDWYTRFGFIYFTFMNDRYKRKD